MPIALPSGQVCTAALLTAQEAQLKAYEKQERERLQLLAGVREEMDGEVPSKYLSSKIKARKGRTLIREVQHGGVVVSSTKAVLEAATSHFRTAFGDSRQVEGRGLWDINVSMALKDEERQQLLVPWSEKEVARVLRELAMEKAPGSDGLPKEFFQVQWSLLGGCFMEFIKAFEVTAHLPTQVSEAVTILLHKKGPADSLLNYRPITLLNSTYKVVAKILANRMKPVMNRVISEGQHGFLPGRRLADAVAIVADVVDAARNGDSDWFLLLVDFEKAYDSVDRSFLFGTMAAMGFPGPFMRWVEGLHAGSGTRLCVNGWVGERIDVGRGVRQGCPLAPYLFLCAVEPLCQEAVRRKLGLAMKGWGRLAYVGYADDTTLILNGKRQLEKATVLLKDFEEVSGLRTNVAKSSVMPLGKNARALQQPDSGYRWVGLNEAERLLGIWVSPGGGADLTWGKAFERAKCDLGKWQSSYLTTSARVTIINSYILPIFLFQAQVYPPPPGCWKQIKSLVQNFVSSNKGDVERHFTLWSYSLICAGRKEGGLGVVEPKGRLEVLVLKSIGDAASQHDAIKVELTEKAAGFPLGWASLYAHPLIRKHWGSGGSRWRQIADVFMRAEHMEVKPAEGRWEIEKEQLAFNKSVLFNRGVPFGGSKKTKMVIGLKVEDLVVKRLDGSRMLKSEDVLASEYGSTVKARMARRAFEAAPEAWKAAVLKKLVAEEIVEAVQVVCTKGFPAPVTWWWEILGVVDEKLRCRRIEVLQGKRIVRKEGAMVADLDCWEVTPVRTDGEVVLGVLGEPRTRLLGTALWDKGAVAALRKLRAPAAAEAKTKQQLKWEEVKGGLIDWGMVIRRRDSMATPAKARDLLLRVHSRNLQVGERLHFLEARGVCPHCMAVETLDHCLYSCPTVQPVVTVLKQALLLLNPARQVDDLQDLLFQDCGTPSGFPEQALIAVTLQKIWLERCDAVFRGDRFQRWRALRRICVAFNLHMRLYVGGRSRRRGQGRPKGQQLAIVAEEDKMLSRIQDSTAGGMTWNVAFQALWTNPRRFWKPP